MPDYAFVGRELGRYQLLQGVGRGGMAEVYLAEDRRLDRKVAIKILPAMFAQEPTFLARFEREARSAARLQHPHILSVYDYGQQDGITYLVMPYLEGGSLAQVISQARGPLPLNKVAQWTEEMGSALSYAHSQGIIHRDVKPGNMLMSEGDHLLLSDFGIAKVVDANTALTHTGSTVGSPEYMAPEQASGEAEYRSDIYSLGVVIFQMLTGRLPFSASTPVQVMLRHVQEPPPSPRSLNPALSPQVEAVVLRALAKNPNERYQSASELADALKAAIRGRPQPPAADLSTRLAPGGALPGPLDTRLAAPPAPPPTVGPAPAYPAGPASLYPASIAAPPANAPRSRSRPADAPRTNERWTAAPGYPSPPPPATWVQEAPAWPPAPAPNYPPPAPPRKRGQRALLAILIILLLVAAALGGSIFYLVTHPGSKLFGIGLAPVITPAATLAATVTTGPTGPATLYQQFIPYCTDQSLWTLNSVTKNGNINCKSDGLYVSRPDSGNFTASLFLNSFPNEPATGFPANYRLDLDTSLFQFNPAQQSNNFTGYGIVFRNQPGNGGYFFLVDPIAGVWLFKLEDAQGAVHVLKREPSNQVQKGSSAVNHLRVDVQGNQFTGYVNGVEVGSVSDDSFSGGNVGLVVAFLGMTVLFTNFVMTSL